MLAPSLYGYQAFLRELAPQFEKHCLMQSGANKSDPENRVPGDNETRQRNGDSSLTITQLDTIHLFARLGPSQQVAEGISNLDCRYRCNLAINVPLQFLKTMRVVAIRLRLEGSP
ncbi:hypothetical protein TNCV_936731 [Trichonephila clavipes]|nr:hypothetical protein TNCV_936731 [Trichonephila clavipes]